MSQQTVMPPSYTCCTAVECQCPCGNIACAAGSIAKPMHQPLLII